MNTPLADYVEHCQAFQELLTGSPTRRILLIEGKSGSGKTTLLTHCLRSIPADLHVVKVQLRGSVTSIAEIFYRIGGTVGWRNLANFQKVVARFQETPQVQIDSNWLAGINNHINVALQTREITDREQRRADLTHALFTDLSQVGRDVLFIFDTYEQATDELKAWISGPFLVRVAETPLARVAIAGQQVPDANNIEWGDRSTTQKLRGVPNAEHWMPILNALKPRIDADDPKSYMKGLCDVLQGDPDEIMKYLSARPRNGC